MSEEAAWELLSAGQLAYLVDDARRAGIELDQRRSADWLRAMQLAYETASEFQFCTDHGIGGHELAMIDFDPATLDRLRQIGRIIAIRPRSEVQCALAISGSSAQSRIQPYPSDLDYFERIHIVCPRRDEARTILAEVIRDNALAVAALPGLLLDEVFFGTVSGQPLRWSPLQVLAGNHSHSAGLSHSDTAWYWPEMAMNPGFIKLDWLLLDRALGGPAKVSKVVDATWSGPNGAIVSLDESVDADYQQIYLDAASAELAALLTRDLPRAIRDDYVDRLERAIVRYRAATPPDYAKVAKRLYNVCRLTGRYGEAIYLRELFDEPTARAAQAMARLRFALLHPSGGTMTRAEMASAIADLAPLLTAEPGSQTLRAAFDREEIDANDDVWISCIRTMESHVLAIVNAVFHRRLHDFPPTATLLEEIADRHAGHAAPHGHQEKRGD
ncbi:MAG: hypothetical protein ACRDJH_02425 [Thermomicrobiales bacterium]